MSEENDRNLQSVAPEAKENENIEQAKDEAKAAEGKDRSPAKKSSSGKKKGKKKGKGRSAIVPVAIALAVLLVVFALLVGYGLGRVRGGEGASDAEPGAEVTSEPAYDAFTEALTQQNEHALEALAGGGEEADADMSILMGEDDLFNENAGEAEDGDDEAPAAEPVVVAEYGDGKQVMSDEVMEAYNEELNVHILSGSSEEEVADTLLNDVLRSAVSARVEEEHAKELGLYELSEEDRAEIEAEAREDYEEYVQFYRDSELDAEGMSEEEAEAAAREQLLESDGVSYESIVAQLEEGRWAQKLFDHVTGDVTVDDAAVQAAYDARVAEQEKSFNDYPDDYEFSQWNGDLVLYNLPGYRAVKMLLLGFDDEESAMTAYALNDELGLLDAGIDEAERQAALDECYAGPEARAQEALAQLRGGASMDELILSIGEDEGMKDDRRRAQGYYISEDSSQPEELVAAAMALENVGDYTEPIRVEDGVCILQYIGDVAQGPVPLDQVRDELREEVLTEARNNAYNAQVRAWVEEAHPTYYPERMQ